MVWFWQGYILLPAVLSPEEIAAITNEIDNPPPGKSFDIMDAVNAPHANALLDHPALVPILTELLTEPPFDSNDDCHPFRCEGSFTTIRE